MKKNLNAEMAEISLLVCFTSLASNISVLTSVMGPLQVSDHMVQKPPYRNANCALGTS